MYSDGFDPRILKFCAYSGLFFAFLWPFAAGVITGGHYILPPSAADSAAEVVADYEDSLVRIRIGATVLIFASMLYITFGMAVSMVTRKRERQWPILYHIQLISLACCVVVVFLIGYFWGAASWRAGDVEPDVTQALNDVGWLGVLYTGAPFAVYMLALAGTILMDRSERPVYPRWCGYFNIFVSFFMFEASLILFFKEGAFSQNGVAVFWVPMVVFFSWIVVMSILAVKAINAETAERGRTDQRVDPSGAPATGNGHVLTVSELTEELHRLRADMAQLSGRLGQQPPHGHDTASTAAALVTGRREGPS